MPSLPLDQQRQSTEVPIFVRVSCGRGSVFLWQRCDTLRTYSFTDDITFSYHRTTHTTILCLCGLCPGQPGWASTRRYILPSSGPLGCYGWLSPCLAYTGVITTVFGWVGNWPEWGTGGEVCYLWLPCYVLLQVAAMLAEVDSFTTYQYQVCNSSRSLSVDPLVLW